MQETLRYLFIGAGIAGICLSSAYAADNRNRRQTAGVPLAEAPAAPKKEASSVQVKSVPVEVIRSTDTTAFPAFFVFTEDNSKLNHFVPSGWMGDTADLKCSGSYQKPYFGKSCLKVIYLGRGRKEWAGIYWQNPANNWGDAKGGFDLRGAAKLTFWAKGEKGGEILSEVKMGGLGLTAKNPDSDTAWIGPVTLTKEWKQYTIPLKDRDLRYINGGFCFTVLKADNPNGCAFYLDEIRYE